jgi:hypothetical protein
LTVLDVQEKRTGSLLVRDSFSFRKDTSQIQSPSVHPHAKVQINLTQGLLSSQKIIDGLRPGLLLPYWTLSYPLYILCIGQNVKRSSSNTARENDLGRRGRPFRFSFSSSGRKKEKKKNKIATGTSSPLHTHQTELNCRASKKKKFLF